MSTLLLNRTKIALAVVGFCLAVGGVALDLRPLVWAAMASLAGAMALRLYLRREVGSTNPKGSGPTTPSIQ